MNCSTHTETAATAFCRACGKALCDPCQQPWQGVVYCNACLSAQQAAPPVPAAPPAGALGDLSPALAFFLGLIPGVGAIYNGQYGKGVLHVVVLGMMFSIINSNAVHGLEPLFGMLIAAWWFYMALEAYHTAKKRQAGEAVDEFSGIFSARGRPGRAPVGPLVLILLGVVFLLNTLEVVRMEQIMRFWPLLLILAGAYWLYARMAGRAAPGGEGPAEGGN